MISQLPGLETAGPRLTVVAPALHGPQEMSLVTSSQIAIPPRALGVAPGDHYARRFSLYTYKFQRLMAVCIVRRTVYGSVNLISSFAAPTCNKVAGKDARAQSFSVLLTAFANCDPKKDRILRTRPDSPAKCRCRCWQQLKSKSQGL